MVTALASIFGLAIVGGVALSVGGHIGLFTEAIRNITRRDKG